MIIEIIPNWHPIFVHFTVGLLATATGLFILAKCTPKTTEWRATCIIVAHWNLWIGVIITIGTVFAGRYAATTVLHADQLHPMIFSHRNWALLTTVIFAVLSLWALFIYKKEPHSLFVVGLFIATILLSVTAYKGGDLVYRHGLGVMSLPNTDKNLDQQEKGNENHLHDH